jgi:hypothetical protein
LCRGQVELMPTRFTGFLLFSAVLIILFCRVINL